MGIAVPRGFEQLAPQGLEALRRRACQTGTAQPPTQQGTLAGDREPGQRGAIQRLRARPATVHEIASRQGIHRIGRCRGLAGGAGERCIDLRMAGAQHRQHLLAQPGALEVGVLVGRVGERIQTALLHIGGNGFFGHSQPGPQVAGAVERRHSGHAGPAMDTTAAQQRQQQGLGLIVAMVRRHQAVVAGGPARKGGVAGLARGRLGPLACVRAGVHRSHLAAHPQSARHRTAVRSPGIGLFIPAVVDMHGEQAPARQPSCEQVQQKGGVGPAAEADHDARAGRRMRGEGRIEVLGGVATGGAAGHGGRRLRRSRGSARRRAGARSAARATRPGRPCRRVAGRPAGLGAPAPRRRRDRGGHRPGVR